MKILFRLPAILILFCAAALSASPRMSVVKIECSPDKKFDETVSRISTSFYTNGYRDISNYLESLRKGWRGTGFVVRDRYGRYFIVSNKHILGNSDKITITFNGSQKKLELFYKDSIIIEDRHLDIAMIALPRGRYRALALSARKVDDGTEIFSAGYPDLLGSPTWQLAKGVVTNFSTPVPSIIDPKLCRLIQHSADIDPGSSGGPLLLKRGGGNWSVVGVSAFTIMGRNNTHFAVPAAKVRSMMSLYQKRKTASRNKRRIQNELSGLMKEISRQFNKAQWDTAREHRYASIPLTAEVGWESLKKLFNSGDDEFLNKMKPRFQSLGFFNSMRECVSWAAWKNYRSGLDEKDKGFTFVKWKTVPAFRKEGTKATALIKLGDKTSDMEFIYERGHWYMNSLPDTPEVKSVYNSESDSSPSGDWDKTKFAFGVSLLPPFLNYEYTGSKPLPGAGAFFGWENGVFRNFSYTHTLHLGYMLHEVTDDFEGTVVNAQSFTFEYQFALRLRFPFSAGSVTVTPYFLGGIDFVTAFNDHSMFNFAMPLDAGGGLELHFKNGHGIGFNTYRRFHVIDIESKIEDMKFNIYYTYSGSLF